MARAVDDHEVERRRHARRRRPPSHRSRRPCPGPAGGMIASERFARALGERGRAHARHGRHERRRRDHRRRRSSGTRPSTRSSGACPRRSRSSTSSRSAPAAARSRGSTPAASCASARERRRRSPARSATAAAAAERDGHGREPPARPPQPRLLPRRADAARPGASPRSRSSGVAAELGMEPLELAASIVEIANENMASAIKMVSLERGHDPRRFALLAFGGAGPLHAAAIARSARHPAGDRSAVPRGLLRARPAARRPPRRQGVDAGVPLDRGRLPALVERQFGRIAERAVAELRQEGFTGEPRRPSAISMRYLGQNYEHEVRDAGRARSTRRCSRRHSQALRAAPRGAIRLRDRGRGDRAGGLQGDGDRAPARAATCARAPACRSRDRAAEREVFFRGPRSRRRPACPPVDARARGAARRSRASSRRRARRRSSSRTCPSSGTGHGSLVITTEVDQ